MKKAKIFGRMSFWAYIGIIISFVWIVNEIIIALVNLIRDEEINFNYYSILLFITCFVISIVSYLFHLKQVKNYFNLLKQKEEKFKEQIL